jgi:tRNA 2-selenouridine synthase
MCISPGMTGTGKTLLLDALLTRGEQVLDLEFLAKHKGSLLGAYPEDQPQPAQKRWESQLRRRLLALDPQRPVWVESESVNIGKVVIPPVLFKQMLKAEKRYKVCLPMAERVKHIIHGYPEWIRDPDNLKLTLSYLGKRVREKSMIDAWCQLVDECRWDEFVEQLLSQHYDPSYIVSQERNKSRDSCVEDVDVTDLSDDSVRRVVDTLISHGGILDHHVQHS